MPRGIYVRTIETREKMSRSKIGNKNANWTQEARRKKGESQTGEKHFAWKGDKVSYRCLHSWVQRELGRAKRCVFCGLSKIPKGMKRYFQWANKSGFYRRDLNDWIELCIPCHKEFDK